MNEPWYAYAIFAVALSGTILNVRKDRRCWPLWIASNAASAVYLAGQGVWTQAALQTIFLGVSLWGWRAWRARNPPGNPGNDLPSRGESR
ncbi:MAG: nicotinamide mononucleotide transporter [Phycisphaerae bacterium]|nr:nicotinamide mononucleotide transporter [Phycisphaerae bacterium]